MDQQPTPTIRIFRPGTFTSNEGAVLSFSQADLAATAAAYDADSDPAPLVIGHPELNDPAWGWVGKLSIDGDTLVAEAQDIEPSFARPSVPSGIARSPRNSIRPSIRPTRSRAPGT